MHIITLTSDYGSNTYYLAVLKAKLLALVPTAVLVDISHNLPAYDLTQAAFLLQSSMAAFEQPTIHLIAVDTNLAVYQNIIVAKKFNQWVIAADNGFISMLDEEWEQLYKVDSTLFNTNDLSPEKNIFTWVAAKIINNAPLESFLQVGTPKISVDNLKPVVEPYQLRATIVHVDGYDNAITNLSFLIFNDWVEDNKYTIYYRKKDRIDTIATNYADVNPGVGVAVFNDKGWLEIAINRGQGKSLLGLKLGDQIIIEKLNNDK